MNIPVELPVVYTTQILIPGFILKIRLETLKNSDLLNYLYQDLKNTESTHMIGIIPLIDIGKVDNVIGTVGLIQSVIQIGSVSEEFFLLVQGICRFLLNETISVEPLKIVKITPIDNFKILSGDENEKTELKVEFEKTLSNLITYSEPGIINPLINKNFQKFLKQFPLHLIIEYFLKNIIQITPSDAYEILRATSLNALVKFVINWMKQKTIKENNSSTFDKTGLLSLPSAVIIGSNTDKKKILKKHLSPELEEIYTAIKNSNMPAPVYDVIIKDFNRLLKMNSFQSDYSVYLNYVNYVVNLPWNKSTKETLDLEKARNVLQLEHYGMDEVKKRIIQFIAVKILNPERRGPILCLIGPPGVGKTTIAKAIGDSLNRTFKRISLGGINNFSDIKGHRKTYIGAMPGRIIQAISQAQTNNPIILLDEIDKMYKGPNGDPAAALLEVLDPEQNNSFVDSYVNVPFDISQVMFISTANHVAGIPQTLRDRLEIIYLEGYTVEEKMKIAENYLIPKLLKDLKMNELHITICKNTINNIIRKYTCEAGVRELQRKLEAICHYIAVEIVENSDKESKNYVITPESLINILGNEIYNINNVLVEKSSERVGIAIGLSWSPTGGLIQVIEASKIHFHKNNSQLVLTGLVGQTLRESVAIALNWIQSFAKKNELDINNCCIHVHLPYGGLKKDGPSAGITIVCAIVSLLWEIPLKPMIAMTGEISLKGDILPVGGVKDKILAAYNANLRTIIIPEFNMKDVNSLPENIREDLNIIPVNHLKEVLDVVIPGGLAFLQNPTVNLVPRSKI
ncbi:lon protease homolog 2, peroxisomal-like [Sipha flava]|uniref:Lon protease homolog n=1 Tax=Sipha flava TaxID=143950 RepID=A0A2S2R3Y0_9HEMI|nr:lon protease homolog 2, peroxisomal-like [Sipha flava]